MLFFHRVIGFGFQVSGLWFGCLGLSEADYSCEWYLSIIQCIPDSMSDTLLDNLSTISVRVSTLLVSVSTLSRSDVILLQSDRFSEL